jgi:hypothetical protein
MSSGLTPGASRLSNLRKLLEKMVCAEMRKTAAPRFWVKIRMPIAMGILGAGIRFWIAMKGCEG